MLDLASPLGSCARWPFKSGHPASMALRDSIRTQTPAERSGFAVRTSTPRSAPASSSELITWFNVGYWSTRMEEVGFISAECAPLREGQRVRSAEFAMVALVGNGLPIPTGSNPTSL